MASLPESSFRVDIEKLQLYITLEFFFLLLLLFYFALASACNFVFYVLCVIAVKVIVNVCKAGVKLNYIRLILNRKEPYTVYVENKEKHNHEI